MKLHGLLAAFALMVAACCNVMAQAQPAAPKPPETRPAFDEQAKKTPLIFYVARGGPDECGPGCSEWIVVEGTFDTGASGRFVAFLRRVRGEKLPVFFRSPGGLGSEALAIGRTLR